MLMRNLNRRLLDKAGGEGAAAGGGTGAGAGAGGADGAVAAAAAAAASAAAASAGAGAGAASAGAGAGAGAAGAGSALGAAPAGGAAAAPGPLDFLQAKYHVKSADGKLDEAASIRKQAEAYAPLVKRLGTDELPPAAPTDYKITAPKDSKPEEFDAFLKDPVTVAALDKFHKAGMTNSQVDMAMGAYLEAAKQLAAGAAALTTDQVTTDLRKDWKTDQDFTKNVCAARHVATVLGQRVGMDFAAIEASGLGNNAAFIRMMASLAPEFAEDRSAAAGSVLPATDLEALTKSKAYMDPNHPDHASTKARVAAHFAAIPGAAQKPKGPVTIQL